tara:strand:+ start:750 stop:887 length:138 start_codon:yes stop_codon:yes gene_type:complete
MVGGDWGSDKWGCGIEAGLKSGVEGKESEDGERMRGGMETHSMNG